MDKETIFEAWSPAESEWSDWTKPVLFAQLPRRLSEVDLTTHADLSWVPPADRRCAMVIELPGVESVALGLALAEKGYRPVPLFNACPAPESVAWFSSWEEERLGPLTLVDVDSILSALVQGAERLRSLSVAVGAPPVFLLDALRKSPRRPPGAGLFDNRSIVFTTDFPSAHLLAERNISQVIVVTREGGPFQDDLDHVLRTWRRGGMSLSQKRLDRSGLPQPLDLPRPSRLFAAWIHIAARFGLRGNAVHGFGGFVPAGG